MGKKKEKGKQKEGEKGEKVLKKGEKRKNKHHRTVEDDIFLGIPRVTDSCRIPVGWGESLPLITGQDGIKLLQDWSGRGNQPGGEWHGS